MELRVENIDRICKQKIVYYNKIRDTFNIIFEWPLINPKF